MSNNLLANLLDISLANPVDGQTLIYNGETEKWENKESGGVTLQIIQPASGPAYSIPTYEELQNIDLNTITKVIATGDTVQLFSINHPAPVAPFYVSIGKLWVSENGSQSSIQTLVYIIDSNSVTFAEGPSIEATKS